MCFHYIHKKEHASSVNNKSYTFLMPPYSGESRNFKGVSMMISKAESNKKSQQFLKLNIHLSTL